MSGAAAGCTWVAPDTSFLGKWAVREKEASNTFVLPYRAFTLGVRDSSVESPYAILVT